MTSHLTFDYNNNSYHFVYNPLDASGLGCILEIVTRDDYQLHLFKNHVGAHFIDIGANCGVATIILAKQNPESTIYSYEPDIQLFKTLTTNVEINNLKNVKCFNMAVTKPGVKSLRLHLNPACSGGNTTYANTDVIKAQYSHEWPSYEVECISLDEIFQQHGIDNLELLKIDCEGAEYDILYNSQCLNEYRIYNIVGEFHNLVYNQVDGLAADLIKYCQDRISNLVKVSILTV